MISFDKPDKFDGGKIVEELIAAGVSIAADEKYPFGVKPPEIDGNNMLWLAIKATDKSKAQSVLDAHNG